MTGVQLLMSEINLYLSIAVRLDRVAVLACEADKQVDELLQVHAKTLFLF